MPLPTLLLFAFASGVAVALGGRAELRISPRPALLTRTFGGYMMFVGMLLLPISVYFYVFHGDWFLMYLTDVQEIPSAVALLGFLVEGAIGAGGFLTGAALVRNQREGLAGTMLGAPVIVALGLVLFTRDRLGVVGSYAQYRGRFGLEPYGSGSLMQGTLLMGGLLVLGLVGLLVRIYMGSRRS